MFIFRWIFCIFFLVVGITIWVKPELAKWWFKRKGLKKIKWFLFWLTLTSEFYLLICLWEYENIFARIFIGLGMLLTVKIFFVLRRKVSEAFMIWFSVRKPSFFRLSAIAYISFGIILFFL